LKSVIMRRTIDDSYMSAINARVATRASDGSVHYACNAVVSLSNDSGVSEREGSHGRLARFRDTRLKPLVGDTKDYTIALTRGNITSANIPLLCPRVSGKVNDLSPAGLGLAPAQYEVTLQPGLAMTWTGPVFLTDNVNGVQLGFDQAYVAWPLNGQIPYYTVCTLPNVGVSSRKSGYVNLAGTFGSEVCTLATMATRVNNALATAGLSTVTLTAPSASSLMSQYYTFTNSSTTTAVYFDFTFPSGDQQYNGGVAGVQKGLILKACKYLGFSPNTVFAVPPTNVAVTLPRPYQPAFRSTIVLYSYKTGRWIPEDLAASVPTLDDIKASTTSTYFDCYTYDHLLTTCVNPTFQRCIYDAFDGNQPISEQCLTKQLKIACAANCSGTSWNPAVSYSAGQAVYYNGRAYVAVFSNINSNPLNGQFGQLATSNWMDCGESIMKSWSPIVQYGAGDIVTAKNYSTGYITSYTSSAGGSIGIDPESNTASWVVGTAMQFSPSTVAITPNVPAIGTLAPTVTFNPGTQLFTMNLDSYGFGGTAQTNVDDGFGGNIDDPTNSATGYPSNLAALNDQARDSWGLTGVLPTNTPAYTVYRRPYDVYDEKFNVEADDYFDQLFGNWPVLNLLYVDPRTSLVTSYVRYIFQAANAGLSVPTVLPLFSPTVVSTSVYQPYGRVAGNQPYLYTYPQNYPSVGLMWQPVDTLVLTTEEVPVEDDQVGPLYAITDNGVSQQTTGNTQKILAEFVVKPVTQNGQEYRNEIIYEPQVLNPRDMQSSQVFKTFDFQVKMRMKGSQILRPLSLSNGGSMNMSFVLERKRL